MMASSQNFFDVVMGLHLTTFSISAREVREGSLGVTASTKEPAVGSLRPFIQFGADAVSTQAWVNPNLGPLILNRLENSECAEKALTNVMAVETEPELRQVGVDDAHSGSAAFTGAQTDGWSGSLRS